MEESKLMEDPDPSEILTVRLPRYRLRLVLYDLMSEISEDCWSARWLDGNECNIWNLLQEGSGVYGRKEVTQETISEVRRIAETLGEWPAYVTVNPETTKLFWVPIEEWPVLMEASKKLDQYARGQRRELRDEIRVATRRSNDGP